MKFRKLIFILIPLIFIGFMSCNDRPIFAAIEQEIELNNFSVAGNVLSLLEVNNNVYAANLGGVYSKSKTSDGSWSKILSAQGTQQLASNGTVAFACFASGSVKYYENGSWKDVPNSENIRIIAGNKIVFGYDSSQKQVFKIEETGLSTSIDTGKVDSLSAAGNYVLVKSGSSEKLYKNGVSSAVPDLPSGAKAICPAGADNEIFVLAGSTIYYYDGSTFSSSIPISGSPDNISYFKAGTRKTILIGCAEGYTEVQLDGSTPINLSNAKQLNPGNSGSTTPSGSYSQYQTTLGSYYSFPLLGVSRGGDEYAVFMGIYSGVIQRNAGLWGFYSDKKREWNRE
ncbi:hypothetical protein [Treponema putidum]|uniref:Lipoprotein n=1 Tax=Treponema putidum TaxID=221027 RepID=A0AAE9MTH8_9SPIR|nr:hypothetical protein [Treponema putidum]AIN93616.1 hypothetical protein JO40_05390 [Treponema putidum]TWI75497.1 hypothetical protein JM98_01946 [Treponema putidum]UTY32314.1 hypothetical protein E4N75_13245 [Treponema putidum]UTY34720.1 hypothetical protein E4N74_12445 [Treponema putidum]